MNDARGEEGGGEESADDEGDAAEPAGEEVGGDEDEVGSSQTLVIAAGAAGGAAVVALALLAVACCVLPRRRAAAADGAEKDVALDFGGAAPGAGGACVLGKAGAEGADRAAAAAAAATARVSRRDCAARPAPHTVYTSRAAAMISARRPRARPGRRGRVSCLRHAGGEPLTTGLRPVSCFRQCE